MRIVVIATSEVWNKVYKSDRAFWRGSSNFALLCFKYMKTNGAKSVLELGTGHGSDTIFLRLIEGEALDYSVTAVEILDKIA